MRSIRAAAAPCKYPDKIGQDEQVTLRLTPSTREGVELELWAVEQEKDYFREVFGRELFG